LIKIIGKLILINMTVLRKGNNKIGREVHVPSLRKNQQTSFTEYRISLTQRRVVLLEDMATVLCAERVPDGGTDNQAVPIFLFIKRKGAVGRWW
jgi:hypothetical protein